MRLMNTFKMCFQLFLCLNVWLLLVVRARTSTKTKERRLGRMGPLEHAWGWGATQTTCFAPMLTPGPWSLPNPPHALLWKPAYVFNPAYFLLRERMSWDAKGARISSVFLRRTSLRGTAHSAPRKKNNATKLEE